MKIIKLNKIPGTCKYKTEYFNSEISDIEVVYKTFFSSKEKSMTATPTGKFVILTNPYTKKEENFSYLIFIDKNTGKRLSADFCDTLTNFLRCN